MRTVTHARTCTRAGASTHTYTRCAAYTPYHLPEDDYLWMSNCKRTPPCPPVPAIPTSTPAAPAVDTLQTLPSQMITSGGVDACAPLNPRPVPL